MSAVRSATVGNRDQETTAPSFAAPRFSDRTTNLVAALLLAAAIGTLYVRSLNAPLFFDDDTTIRHNVSLRQLWPLWGNDHHRGPFNPEPQLSTSGRPLVNLSLALNYAWGAIKPAGYRAVNLGIHYLSALLLMLIVRRTLRLPYFHGRFDVGAGPLAILVALVWAVHPLQTEAVAYITQRTELMVVCCYLATLYCAIRYWAAPLPPSPLSENKKRRSGSPAHRAGRAAGSRAERAAAANRPGSSRGLWLVLAILAAAAGAACKEIIVTAPAVVLLYEWTFLGRSLRRITRESWPLYAGLIATWLLLLYLNLGGPRSDSTGFSGDFSPWNWWSTQAAVFWMYLKLAVWPHPLIIHYEFPLLDTWGAAWPWVLPTLVLLAITLVLLGRRWSAGFVAASVMIMLSPTSIVPIVSEMAAERRMYLPLAPLIAWVVAGGYSLLQSWRIRQGANASVDPRRPLAAVCAVAIFVALVFGVVSARRLDAYVALVPIWEDAVARQPANYTANYNLGVSLLLMQRNDEALDVIQRTAKTWPDSWRIYIAQGEALTRLGKSAEAIDCLAKVVGLRPEWYDARVGLGVLLSSAGRYDEAIRQVKEAAQLRPAESRPQFLWALALSKSGRPAEAIEHYQQALRIDEQNPEVHNNLGVAFVKLGRQEEAEAHFRRALALSPDYVDAQKNLAEAREQAGDLRDAIRRYQDILQRHPNDFDVYAKLAEVYVRANEPARAFDVAEKAARLAHHAGQTAAAEQIENWLRAYRAQQANPASPPPVTAPNPSEPLPKSDSSAN